MYVPKFDERGLPIRNRPRGVASSYVAIEYCPWCGAHLAESKRDAWFDELERRGLEPDDDLPAELLGDRWWGERP